MSDNSDRPIIIKRKKVSGGDGHHGGAWKVAYADFVTAMMAFFMLMWLLNATTEKQRKGLADYFSPTIAIARVSGGGDGAFGGDSLASEESLAQSGRGGVLELPAMDFNTQDQGESAEQSGTDGDQELADALAGLVGKGGDSLVQELIQKHITAKMTDEGLVVEISDLDGSPLFVGENQEPSEILKQILSVVAEAFSIVSNNIAISSHSAAFPATVISNPAWEITLGRAQHTRKLLKELGFDGEKVMRITGFGQREANPSDPMNVTNNRLEIILLRRSQ